MRPAEPQPWEALLHSSGNPKIPTVSEAMEKVFTGVGGSVSPHISGHWWKQVRRLADGHCVPLGDEAPRRSQTTTRG